MRAKTWIFSGCLMVCTFILLMACGSARRGEPLVGPMSLSDEARQGRIVFYSICDQCHPGGEAGLAPSLNNKPLPGFMIRMQVRKGLGAMPSFDNIQIPDRDLDYLVSYMKELRRSG